jgi:phage-related protein
MPMLSPSVGLGWMVLQMSTASALKAMSKKYFLRYTQKMSVSRKIPAIFYRSASGSEPVREWLKTLDKADRQTVGEDIAYVQYKWPIGKPRVDHLRGPIWEVRSKIGNRIARVLFAVEASEMILLHAFVKKTQQTNPADIELATKRLKEWINGQSNQSQSPHGQQF